ncbi:hypothetical protein KGF56_000983 [Candida oxycetoniae]|uniref:Uncharacterized protein n=1 Tax=Candida oxycetoniae TaxID=497107 RepID=A0AAI9SZN6_9ASCO|nr:uncharacterized protein KGF56_000983 [Candida oxycetoniae]KAI3406141.2 hypothetical protein KGF56_000983 [Candida oxycetoniae]
MWPFSKSEDKQDLEEIGKNLPPDLKEFLIKENPEVRNQSEIEAPYKFESSKRVKQVNRILSQLPPRSSEEELEFGNFKIANQINKVTDVNCAELEYSLHQCYHQFSAFFDLFKLPCLDKQEKVRVCKNLQNDALKLLHYQSCYDIPQCFAIKAFVDVAFVKNFGNLGEKTDNSDSTDQFYKDINNAFDELWKS